MFKFTCRACPVGKTSDEVNTTALLDELPCKFRKGDRVFAKVGADPPWPAQVDILLYEGTTLDLYQVTFYGTLNSCYVNSKHIWPYSPETILKYGRKGHGCHAVFKQAMKDIENEKLFLIAEPLEFPSKETEITKGEEGESGVDENVKEDAGELTGEETVDDANDYKISAGRQHGSSTVESPNKSSSSKTSKMSVPVSPNPTPCENSENNTFISMDTEVNDQDFGSTGTGDHLGLGAPPTPSSGALPPLEKQRPFMMNDFPSHSQGVNSPPSAFGPDADMAGSMQYGWNSNCDPALGRNYQPCPPMHQTPGPFHFDPPPYCNYNTATVHSGHRWDGYGPHNYPSYPNPYPYQPHSYQPPPANWGSFGANSPWLEPGHVPLQSRPLSQAVRMPKPKPMSSQLPVVSLLQQVPAQKSLNSSTACISTLAGSKTFPTKQTPQLNLESSVVEISSPAVSARSDIMIQLKHEGNEAEEKLETGGEIEKEMYSSKSSHRKDKKEEDERKRKVSDRDKLRVSKDYQPSSFNDKDSKEKQDKERRSDRHRHRSSSSSSKNQLKTKDSPKEKESSKEKTTTNEDKSKLTITNNSSNGCCGKDLLKGRDTYSTNVNVKPAKDTNSKIKIPAETENHSAGRMDDDIKSHPTSQRKSSIAITNNVKHLTDSEQELLSSRTKSPDFTGELKQKNVQTSVFGTKLIVGDPGHFHAVAYNVSHSSLEGAIFPESPVPLVGRISPETIWNYIYKIKKTNKFQEVIVLCLAPATEADSPGYMTFLSDFLSRGRLGVLGGIVPPLKDVYLIPLNQYSPLNRVLLPFRGPGLPKEKNNCLLAVVIRYIIDLPPTIQPKRKASLESAEASSSLPATKKKRTLDVASLVDESLAFSTSAVPASGQFSKGSPNAFQFQSRAIPKSGSSATIGPLADSQRSEEPQPELSMNKQSPSPWNINSISGHGGSGKVQKKKRLWKCTTCTHRGVPGNIRHIPRFCPHRRITAEEYAWLVREDRCCWTCKGNHLQRNCPWQDQLNKGS